MNYVENITSCVEARTILNYIIRYMNTSSEKKSLNRYNTEKLQSVIQEIYHCSNRNVLHELSLIIIFSDSPTPNIFINT